jgi:hypothetical protein
MLICNFPLPPSRMTDTATLAAPSAEFTERLRLIQWMAVGSLLGLIVLGLLWELWLAPIRPGGSWLALKVLPLCIAQKPHVHLPLGELDGVAVFRRRHYPRHIRSRAELVSGDD